MASTTHSHAIPRISHTMTPEEIAEWERRLKANTLFVTGDPESPMAVWNRRWRAWKKGRK